MPLDETAAGAGSTVSDKTLLAFGALLHDVGKIVHRGISAGGTHSKLGADFITQEVGAANPGFEGDDGKRIVEQVRHHHAAEMAGATALQAGSLAWITYFADNISAGMDRKNEGDDPQAAHFHREAKLRKIFNILNGHHDDNTIEHDDYNAIRERIKAGLAGIEVSQRGINSLLNLLEATTDKVPSSTNLSELVDVSLYDHARTTAGIALCIYEYLAEQQVTDYKEALFNREQAAEYYARPMFLLYSCDMSGIQSFIYTISGSGALRQLRARSFFLEMMLEHIVDELLERLHLSRANLLYTGGGHAYLLLPNTLSAKDELARFTSELQAWFLEHYKTDLYLASAWLECSADDLSNRGDDKQRYGNLFRALSQDLSAAKASRYTADMLASLNFGDEQGIDHSRECTECHRSDLALDSDGKCPLCSALGKIAADIVRKEVFVVTDPSEQPKDDGSSRVSLLLPFDRRLTVYSEEEYLAEQAKALNPLRIYTKNNWHTGISLATHIWMGDYAADTQGRGIGAYASSGATLDSGRGIRRLGVLRADIDNLGMVFVAGIPADKISISRTATLSRELSHFFRFRINGILEAGGYQAQIVYSGGDDLFVIGNWNDIIHAAMDIRQAFSEFIGNGTLTISAGIGMFDSKYPIARMAVETGSLEDAAKLFCRSGNDRPTKDAVALWSTAAVFGWDEFTGGVFAKLNRVKEAFERHEKGKAFIYHLVSLLRATDTPLSISRLAYLLARSFEDDEGNGVETSRVFFGWAMDADERRHLVAALEWYVYSIRERG
jgi:CRISPR-associated protein Csm1